MTFPSICIKFTFVTISQLEVLSYSIVFFKHIAQCSNQFSTDPNWLITNPFYNCINLKSFSIHHYSTYSIFRHFSLFFIIWHANYLRGVCNWSDLLISIYSNIAVFYSIFWYISISHSIFNICEYLTSSFPSSNDVNLFIYYFILPFSDISVVKCLFAMSNVKGWKRNTAFTGLNLLYCFCIEIVLNHLPQIETLFLFNL